MDHKIMAMAARLQGQGCAQSTTFELNKLCDNVVGEKLLYEKGSYSHHVFEGVPHSGAPGNTFGFKARNVFLQDSGPTHEEHMRLVVLRHASPFPLKASGQSPYKNARLLRYVRFTNLCPQSHTAPAAIFDGWLTFKP